MCIDSLNPQKNTRLDSIDLLRGLSILAVILLHLNLCIPLEKSSLGILLPPMFSKILLWSGYYGVMIFFVISGFLITTSSIKRWGELKTMQIKQFYLYRFARIAPCLLALLVLLSIYDRLNITGFVINTENTSLPRAIFAALTFHINWLEAETGYLPGAWSVLWSLSVEEVFYLFFPLICKWIKNERHFIVLMLAFIIIGPFARVAFSTNDIWMDHAYLSCMDGIALGVLAALFNHKYLLSKKFLNAFMIIGLFLTLFVLIFRKQTVNLGLTALGLNVSVLELGIALLLVVFYQKSIYQRFGNNRTTAVFRWFGRNSYEVYLTHTILVLGFSMLFNITNQSLNLIPLWYLGIIALAGLCGHWISRYYSEPLNRMIRTRFIKPVLNSVPLKPISRFSDNLIE